MTAPFAKTAIIALAASVLAAGTVYAQNPVQQQERHDQVKDRIIDTNNRIDQEYRDGDLTHSQAYQMREESHDIGVDASRQAQDGRGLSRGEQRDINRQENALNRQITRQSDQ